MCPKRVGRGTHPYHALLVKRLGAEKVRAIDPFDLVQLYYVIQWCGKSRSMAEAGRHLYRHSSTEETQKNDSDRLKKYLEKFGLEFPVAKRIALEGNR